MEHKRCLGCMRETDAAVCPHCGYGPENRNAAHQLPAGTLLHERYLLGRVLGQGGFGITYIGYDRERMDCVAVKEFYPSRVVNRDNRVDLTVRVNISDMETHFASSKERFLREARALSSMQEVPQIVSIRESFEANNTSYIVMEYIRGTDLRGYIRMHGGKLTAQETLRLLEPVVLALGKVHKQGLVHRDISPDNIMLHPLGGAKLLDFGAVRQVLNPDAEKELTHSTEAFLKHGFAPMEQYWSRGSLGPWTDEYALCATAYYCITGQLPPNAPARSTGEQTVDWSDVPGLTENEIKALNKGMALRAKDRFASMEEFHRALYKGIWEEKDPPKQEEQKKPRKRLGLWLGIGGALAAAAVLAVLIPGMMKGDSSQSVETAPVIQAVTEAPETVPAAETTQPPSEEPAPTEVTTEPATEPREPEPWEANLMGANPWLKLDVEKKTVRTVTFLDTLADAPANAVDVSLEGNGKVLMWRDIYHVYFGAEGGINGRDACVRLFMEFPELTTITFGGAFHTDEATSMEEMFYRCSNLQTVDLECLVTKNVTNMRNMFRMEHIGVYTDYHSGQDSKGNLQNLDIGGWDTGKVRDMSGMFYGCNHLTTLDLGAWNTSSVTNMKEMFTDSSIQVVDYGDWDTSSVTNMSNMFSGCTALTKVNVSGWNTGKVRSMERMFSMCSALREVSIFGWQTENVTNMNYMFTGCGSVAVLDMDNWNTGSLSEVTGMFSNCYSLETVRAGGWDTAGISSMNSMFSQCSRLVSLNCGAWDVSAVTDFYGMFDSCGFSSLDVAAWDTARAENMSHMFYKCAQLTSLEVGGWNTSRVEDVSFMFYLCDKLGAPDVGKWDISSVTEYEMFLNTGTMVNGSFWRLMFE